MLILAITPQRVYSEKLKRRGNAGIYKNIEIIMYIRTITTNTHRVNTKFVRTLYSHNKFIAS